MRPITLNATKILQLGSLISQAVIPEAYASLLAYAILRPSDYSGEASVIGGATGPGRKIR